jgi:hypothetical protein
MIFIMALSGAYHDYVLMGSGCMAMRRTKNSGMDTSLWSCLHIRLRVTLFMKIHRLRRIKCNTTSHFQKINNVTLVSRLHMNTTMTD